MVNCEYLILGAGPAGLQLGYYLHKANRDYRILDAGGGPGRFFTRFPRHRTLISSNKVYTGYTDPEVNLRWDWNSLLSDSEEALFKRYSGRYFPAADDFVRYLEDFAARFQLRAHYAAQVELVRRNGQFCVTTGTGVSFTSPRLIVATGVSLPYLPAIPGIENVQPYTTMSLDVSQFRNKRVLIVGKGNSAFETAEHLLESAAVIHLASPNSVRMAWQSHYVGHLRAVNNNFLDTYQLKSQNAVIDAVIEEIRKEGEKFVIRFRYKRAVGEVEELVYDHVLACTGFRFDSSIFAEECRPALAINGRFPLQTSAWESSNAQDMYFAGTLMQMRDFKKSQSGFIHGFRYNVHALFHILNARYEGIPWPRRTIAPDHESIAEAIIGRINRTSALWQQFGFLGDFVMLDSSGGPAQYFEQVPIDYVRDGGLGDYSEYLQITLEYGLAHGDADPFRLDRVRGEDVDHAELSNFLHPVVRRYVGNKFAAEHHVIENLFGEWKGPEHVKPLQAFIAKQCAVAIGV